MPIQPIRTDASNSFAHESFTRRLPQIIRDIQANNPYPSKIRVALDDLHQQLVNNAPLPPPPLTAPDAQTWLEAYEQHKDETWQNAEWFFAETYFFHLVNDIVRYWQGGSDPYYVAKQNELKSPALLAQINLALKPHSSSESELFHLLEMALWGNRVDLSLPEVLANHGHTTTADDLLVDDRSQAIERLLNTKGSVHLITDNFGTELAMDLLLVHALLKLSIPVVLHVKMHPTYVSDAVRADVNNLLYYMDKQNYAFVMDLWQAQDARLTIAPNFFWNSPHFLNKLPAHLMQLFGDARLIILKGDANYRRAFFDTLWPVDMPANQIVDYLPAPLLCLRTLKSDPLAGVPEELAARAAAANPNWRILGKYGLIQYID